MNYTVDPLQAFDVGLLMAAMQRKRSLDLCSCTTVVGHERTFEAEAEFAMKQSLGSPRKKTMTDETLVFELLARALLEIRVAGLEGNSKATFHLADLFHNVPSQIARIQRGNGNYREVLDWLEMRCKQKGMESWLRTAISDASQD